MSTLVAMLSDIGYAIGSIGKGLGVTFTNLLRPKVTLQYPDHRPELAPRYRGLPIVDISKCIGCLMCERICPNQLIKIKTSRRPDKRLNIDSFTMDYALCMLCNMCEEVCPTDAIVLEGGYELAGVGRDQLRAGIVDGWVKPGCACPEEEKAAA